MDTFDNVTAYMQILGLALLMGLGGAAYFLLKKRK
jgi:hypothetical protein